MPSPCRSAPWARALRPDRETSQELAPRGRSYRGCVAASKAKRNANAWSRLFPHISIDGRKETQNAGRSGLPNNLQRNCSSSCTHATPAGLPRAMPGIGEVIDGAMQQAAQRARHSKDWVSMTTTV